MKLVRLAVLAAITWSTFMPQQAEALTPRLPRPEYCATRAGRVIHRPLPSACRASEVRIGQEDIVLCARKNRPVQTRAFDCKKSETRLIELPPKPIPPLPCICPLILDPVCGVDGRTYPSSCNARCSNVEVAHKGSCAEVLVTTDKGTYGSEDSAAVDITNVGSKTIFLPGCSQISRERKEWTGSSVTLPGIIPWPAPEWRDYGSPTQCVWEGTAVALQPGDSLSLDRIAFPSDGAWRFAARYGLDCTPGEPLSRADCESFETVHSPEVSVGIIIMP